MRLMKRAFLLQDIETNRTNASRFVSAPATGRSRGSQSG